MRSAAEPDRERLRNELEVLRRRLGQQIAPMYPDKRPPGSEEMGPEGVPGGVLPGFPPRAMMPPGYGGTVIHYARTRSRPSRSPATLPCTGSPSSPARRRRTRP